MKILLTSFFNPLEPDSGSGLRSHCLLKNLCDLGHTVHLFTFSQSDNTGRLKAFPNVVKASFMPKASPTRFTALYALMRGLVQLKPLDIAFHITGEVKGAFDRFTAHEAYDAAIFDQLCAFELNNRLQSPSNPKIVMNEHNAEFIMAREFAAQLKSPVHRMYQRLNSRLLRRFEFTLLGSADCVLHVSQQDLDHYPPMIRKKSVVIPNTLPYRTEYREKNPACRTIVFIGSMSHYANVEGILRFLRDIWPGLHANRPDLELLIAGGNPPAEIRQHDGKQNVRVAGFVADLAQLYEQALLTIIPINVGSGSRLKILEAMMHNTLAVSSPKGAEGLNLEAGRHIILAGSREDWIREISYYCDHGNERAAIEKNARDFVEKQYYYDRYRPLIEQCISR